MAQRGIKRKSNAHYGERTCEHPNCTNNAYYECFGSLLCGVHSRKKTRTELPKFTSSEKATQAAQAWEDELAEIEAAATENLENGRRGEVIVTKLRMMKAPDHRKGYLKVFPNFKHQGRKDGFGCRQLSPMYLGPVNHGQPGLPPSQNIENFHQGSKCFAQEVDKHGNPSQLYAKNRLEFYNDPVPHRHKFHGDDKQNKNIPKYFVWVDKEGKEHHLSYIESRQFYCNFYERLAEQQDDYKTLQKKLKDGYAKQSFV
jgi:hypothetical protein